MTVSNEEFVVKRRFSTLMVALFWFLAGVDVVAQEPFRLSDKDVKQLSERIKKGTENFSKKLQQGLKKGEIPGAQEAVRNAGDMVTAARRLEESVGRKRSANADVEDLLRRAGFMDEFMKAHPLVTQADPEWSAVRASLQQLARGFALEWPGGSADQRASRLDDAGLKNVFDRAARNAERFRKSLDSELKKEKALDRGTRSNINRTLSQFEKRVKDLKKNWSEVAALSNDLSATLQLWSGLKEFLDSRTTTPATLSQWNVLSQDLRTIGAAYGIKGSGSD